MFDREISFIKGLYDKDAIPLHSPVFHGNEKEYLLECIDSSFVSSVGKFVNLFEEEIARYTGSKYAVATCSGTSALHAALVAAGVGANDEVITQPVTFVATCNAIHYCGAKPVFVDVDKETMGLSPHALENFLKRNAIVKNKTCFNKTTGRIIKSCIPMHTFGNPCKIDSIIEVCESFCITLIEDAAESVGSYYKKKHTGTFGLAGVLSFNGNKIITAGGGGCVITNDKKFADKVRHLTTTAKVEHQWNYEHDFVGYNYRMPNINAALILAQLEQLDHFLQVKDDLASSYREFFRDSSIEFFTPSSDSGSNNWLNSLVFSSRQDRDHFLSEANEKRVMSRPMWTLMNKLSMYQDCQSDRLDNSIWLEDRVVNIPSGVNRQ